MPPIMKTGASFVLPRRPARAGVAIFFLLTSLAAADARPLRIDLAQNGGFERGLEGWQWVGHGAAADGRIDSTVRHSGTNSFKITNGSPQTPQIYARIVQSVTGLRPFTTYQVSCWAKGRGCGVNWIGGGPGWNLRTAFPTGDFDWRQVSFQINSGADAENYELMILTESTTAALWIDDVRFDTDIIDNARQDAADAHYRDLIGALQRRADALPKSGNAYVALGRAVADRFLQFARNTLDADRPQMSFAWMKTQLEETAQVLDETEKIAGAHSELPDWTPPASPAVSYANGSFESGGRPWFGYGYGHFNSVIDDLTNFPALGASLIQDARFGPSSMDSDNHWIEPRPLLAQALDTAARSGVGVDVLLSPHYYPPWAMGPDVLNGNIGFINYNIFHPKARDALERWAALLAETIHGKPALHSVCLANEPVYNSSGRDPYSRPFFTDYLRVKHKDIAALNALYNTRYTNFEEVPVPPYGMPGGTGPQRAYYDWTCFNSKMFADWHSWLDQALKAGGVRAPTHTKIMVFQSLDRDKTGWGVDPELICHATDLAGCDAYAFLGGAYAYDWIGHEFYYDLLHSFRGQDVFNSENHLIPDNSPRTHIPMNHTRSVLWQDGLHHQTSTAIWVWQATTDPGDPGGLGGSIYFRPANIFGAGRAMLDLNRLAPEVAAINNAKPRVALLYSPPSVFWQEGYKGMLQSLYTALNFMGEPVTFVSERQLAAGTAPAVPWLIVPGATHVFDTTPGALEAFRKGGGKILLAGANCLARDEYDRPRTNTPVLGTAFAMGADDRATSRALRDALKLSNTTDIRQNLDGQPAWGVEFRAVPFGRQTLLSLVNLNNEARKISIPAWERIPAVDLLTGEPVDVKSLTLEPMVPMLLRLGS